MAPAWSVLVAIPSINALAAVLAAGPRWRRWLAIMISGSTAGLPYLIPRDALEARAFAALWSVLGFMKVADLARDRKPIPLLQRAIHTVSLADTRRLRRDVASLYVPALVGVFAYSALGALAMVAIATVHGNGAAWAWAVRWVGGCLFVYGLMDASASAFELLHHALGFRSPHLQERPILSRSLGEFWGRRWNGPVSRWLSSHCFRPLARGGHPRLGMTAAFGWSALVHFLPVLASLGWTPALFMAGFFLLQGALVLAERPLRVARWPRVAQHTWTLGGILVAAPLFVDPVLAAFGLPPPAPLPWVS